MASGQSNISNMAASQAALRPGISFMLSSTTEVTLLSVFREGALLEHQKNPPTIMCGQAADGKRWTWKVVSTEGFTSEPKIWFTHSNTNETHYAQLNYAGIDNSDWEFGVTGKIFVELTSGAETLKMDAISVTTASIDATDFTFFDPGTKHFINLNLSTKDDASKYKVSLEPINFDNDAFEQTTWSGTSKVDIQLKADWFDEAMEGVCNLEITRGSAGKSIFRSRIDVKPLRQANGEFVSNDINLVKYQNIPLEVDGKPFGSSNFIFEVEDFEDNKFRLEPSFADISPSSPVLELEGLSDLDWILGTKDEAFLVVKDGHRPASRIPMKINLEQESKTIFLKAGTKLTGPNGEQFEIVEDGEYKPIISADGDYPDKVVTIENIDIQSINGGSAVNLSANSKLEFDEKIPLVGTATVGFNGLNMGDDDETDDELRDRVRVLWAAPPGHGNRSHLIKIAEQVEGVDRAFVYPSFALEGASGLGKAGVALVAPGRRCGVGHDSALAEKVVAELKEKASFTGNYVVMDVDEKGTLDSSGCGECQVDVEVQVKLEDESLWKYVGNQNLRITSCVSSTEFKVYCETFNNTRRQEVVDILQALQDGDKMFIAGKQVIIAGTTADTQAHEYKIRLHQPVLDEDGEIMTSKLVGEKLYPPCPIQSKINQAIDRVFKDLGTSEAPHRGDDLPWQQRYPRMTFAHPAELRVAELINQIMDIEGVKDMRILKPEGNLSPPKSNYEQKPGGEIDYTTFILSLRRVAIGPYLATPDTADWVMAP